MESPPSHPQVCVAEGDSLKNKVMKPLGITSCQFLWDKLKIISCMNGDIILTIKCNQEMDKRKNELK